MTNIQKYLLGTDKNLSNNVIGTVLAFSTKLDTETPLKITKDNTTALNTPVTISTLVFLDFRTGRIERYLINASIHTFGKSTTLDVDFKNDVYFTWKGERYKIFHDHVGGDQAKFSLINLGDGKITQAFNLIFMVELFRDYLIYESSYNDGNIASLRKITSPITEKIEDINSKVKTSSSGTGHLTSEELEAINQSNEYRLNDFKPFKAECFINYKNKNKDNKHTILVPNNLANTSIKELFNYGHVNIVYSNKKELPQIVKDFTRSFYIKNINNIHNISLRIRSWNYNITKRLKKDFNK